MTKVGHFFEIHKNKKKVSPGMGLKEAYAKFEDDRVSINYRKRHWKMRVWESETSDAAAGAASSSGKTKILAILR